MTKHNFMVGDKVTKTYTIKAIIYGSGEKNLMVEGGRFFRPDEIEPCVYQEPKNAAIEEINARVCRDQDYQFKVLIWSEDMNSWLGISSWKGKKWKERAWSLSGKYIYVDDDPHYLDLIPKPTQWSEIVDVCRLNGTHDLIMNGAYNFASDISDQWKERRYYHQVDGKTIFVRSEVIE